MIDLSFADNQDVFILLKHQLYIIGHDGRSFVPMGVQSSQGQPPTPAVTDHLEGRLRKVAGQFVLGYANPANPRAIVEVAVDSENVAACYTLRSIEIASAIMPSIQIASS